MENFENKTVYFVSDSNLTRPYYLEYLRADCLRTGRKVYLRNKGIPGARMDMVENCIEEELSVEKPDYVALCFGVNDLGIWLYDGQLSETQLLKQQRKERIENYLRALEKMILYLRERKIEPILMTPLCCDENIVEKSGIQTDKDNKEKSAIQNSLFTKATFRNVNEKGLYILYEQGVEIAKRYGVTVWDLYQATKARADNTCFEEDGVHYNPKGHWLVAQEIYKNMFGAKLGEYAVSEEIKALSQAEEDERSYFFVKYNVIGLSYGKKEGEELLEAVRQYIQEKGNTEGLVPKRAEGFFRFAQNPDEKQRAIVRQIKNLYSC